MAGFTLFILSIMLNLFAVILKRKSNLLAYLHIIYVWVIFVFAYDVVDYVNYDNAYYIISLGKTEITDTLEPGYYALSKIVSMMGFNYQVLRGLMFTIIIFLLIASAKKMKTNPNYLCVCFSIYPLFMEMIQIRNAFAMAILTLGICYFLYEGKRTKYVLIVLLASSFHISSLIYLFFAIDGEILKKKCFRNTFVMIIIVVSVLFYLGGKKLPYLDKIVSFLGDSNKVNAWLSSSGNFGFIAYGTLIVIAILITYIISTKTSDNKFSKFMYRINLLSLIFIPLFMLASTFARLSANLCFVNYISWQEGMNFNKNYKAGIVTLRQLLVMLLTFIYLIIWFQLEMSAEFDLRVLSFFENNYFFDSFR